VEAYLLKEKEGLRLWSNRPEPLLDGYITDNSITLGLLNQNQPFSTIPTTKYRVYFARLPNNLFENAYRLENDVVKQPGGSRWVVIRVEAL
jgi:hypothetical protein